EAKGKYIREKLKPLIGNSIVDVRAQGMEIGIGLKNAETARKAIEVAFEKGLHVVVGAEHNLQIMPPLTISQGLLEQGLAILIDVLNERD
ncbi:MAG: aminotransferase class III-fold pyridoxal phosphate-dependent enzyme, partial [Patescibacteria group bacterium]|nr:aminotransferase class III-fold pyridoxal phosphate-dependent enzyme [Patescibacteria group bacterium]